MSDILLFANQTLAPRRMVYITPFIIKMIQIESATAADSQSKSKVRAPSCMPGIRHVLFFPCNLENQSGENLWFKTQLFCLKKK